VAVISASRRGPSTAYYEASERRRIAWMSGLAIGASVLLGQLVIRIGGIAVLIPTAGLLLAAVIWRPRFGLYMLFMLVLLFEQASPDPLMLPGKYLNYGLQSSLGVSGFIASPLELLLILVFAVWLVQSLIRHKFAYRGGDLGWPISLFFVAVVVGIVRGVVGDGSAYIAFWEARSLLYLGICYLLAANLIRSRRDVAMLIAIFLIGNGLYAIEGAYRDLLLVRTGVLDVPQEYVYSHEVVIFLGIVLLQALIQVIVKTSLWLRVMGLALAPIAFYTLLASHRRAGYIALAIAFAIMALPWVVRHRKAMLFVFIPMVIATAVYLPLFWNNTGVLGQPARAVRSLSSPDERDASSNDYRDLEKINVQATIESDPLLGVGFGRPFIFAVPLPDLSFWEFWHYEPHHNILWVWLKTGAPGFIVFWIMMMGALAIAGSRVLTLKDTTLITFAYLALASIVVTLVFCYVDLGLTNGRVTIFLGTVLGVLAVLRQIDADTIAADAAAASARTSARRGKAQPGSVRIKDITPDSEKPGATTHAQPQPAAHRSGAPGRWTPGSNGHQSGTPDSRRPSPAPDRPPAEALRA